MKKLLSIVCVVCMLGLLAACGASAKEYNLSDVLASLDSANPLADARELTKDDLTLLMSVPETDIAEFAGNISGDSTTGAMNVVVKAAEGKADSVKTALDTYRTNQVAIYSAYDPTVAGILEDGRVVAHGDYVVLVLGSSADVYSAVDTAIDEAFK